MLDELTIEANEQSFVIILQHSGNDVTWKRSIVKKLDENANENCTPQNELFLNKS